MKIIDLERILASERSIRAIVPVGIDTGKQFRELIAAASDEECGEILYCLSCIRNACDDIRDTRLIGRVKP